MSSNDLPKKLILALLSLLFLVFAPLAINTWMIGQIGVKNIISDILGGIATETLSSALSNTCGKQTTATYADCEKLTLNRVCLQYSDQKSCQDVGSKGKDYIVKNVILPSALPQVYDYQIPKLGIKVGDIDTQISSLFIAFSGLALISAILMVMVIGNTKEILKILGLDILWVGVSMILVVYGTNNLLPSIMGPSLQGLNDPQLANSLTSVITINIKPLLDMELQVGIALFAIGLISVASSKIFFKK